MQGWRNREGPGNRSPGPQKFHLLGVTEGTRYFKKWALLTDIVLLLGSSIFLHTLWALLALGALFCKDLQGLVPHLRTQFSCPADILSIKLVERHLILSQGRRNPLKWGQEQFLTNLSSYPHWTIVKFRLIKLEVAPLPRSPVPASPTLPLGAKLLSSRSR